MSSSIVIEEISKGDTLSSMDEKNFKGKNRKKMKSPNAGLGLRKHAEKMRTDPEYRQMMIEKYKNNRPNAIAIDMVDKDTMEVIMTFPKIMDGAAWIRENTDYKKADYATINKICKNQGKTAYGYKWRYTKDRK